MGDGIFDRAEEFVSLFRKGAEFTRELLHENETLRKRILHLEQDQMSAARNPNDWEKLRSELSLRLRDLEEEKQEMLRQLQQVEEENQQFAERYLEIEEENNALANLYVASYQLHSTLDPSEVVKTILEIVINLIGAEVFAVYGCDEISEELVAVAAEGDSLSAFPTVSAGDGPIGLSVAEGQVILGDPNVEGQTPSQGGEPMVSIPLHVDSQPVGAIAIYKLLQQKDGFSSLDNELFTLLAGHAATALFASRLYSQSERKLSTIKGIIDLLTEQNPK